MTKTFNAYYKECQRRLCLRLDNWDFVVVAGWVPERKVFVRYWSKRSACDKRSNLGRPLFLVIGPSSLRALSRN